jgi:hypothetical protein
VSDPATARSAPICAPPLTAAALDRKLRKYKR